MSARRVISAALLAGALAVTAACGSSSGGDTKYTGDGASKDFDAKVAADYKAATQEQKQTPPADGPKAASGKKVFVIPCGMTGEGCARTARASMAAAKDIGWDATLIDPQFDPGKTSAAIRQAISAKADAIVLEAIDSSVATAALQEAKDAGIALVCWVCNNTPDLYDEVIQGPDTFAQQGYLAAQAAYELSGQKLRLVMMQEQNLAILKGRAVGTKKFVDECKKAGGNCTVIDTADYQVTAVSDAGKTSAVSLARSNPNYDVFWQDYDGGMAFMSSAITQAGLGKGKIGVAFDGDAASLDQIRSGGFQQVTVGSPATWVGYAQIDTANRLVQDQPSVDEGVRAKVLVPDNVPAKGAWDGDIDVRPAYLKLWGK